MNSRLLVLLILISSAFAQYSHPAVLENEAMERNLPPNFVNPFYRTPRVREALARSSWFGPGEKLVRERKAETIPRSQIYSVLTHAGFIPRRYF